MKVLHVIHDFLPRHGAGSEIYVDRLCRAQAARGLEVAVLCAECDPAREHGTLVHRMHRGLRVLELVNNWAFPGMEQAWSSPLLGRELARLLEKERPDLLHLHSLLTLPLDLPLLARRRGIRCVATLHDHSLLCPAGGTLVPFSPGPRPARVCSEIRPGRCAVCLARSPFGARLALALLARLSGKSGRPAPGQGEDPVLARAAALARLGLERFPAACTRAARTLGPGLLLPLGLISTRGLERRLELVQQAVKAMDLVVSPSRYLACAMQRLGLGQVPIRVSDYGIDLAGQPGRQEPGAGQRERVRVGFVGTLVPHKGAHVLLQALSLLLSERQEAHLEVELFGNPEADPGYVAWLGRLAHGLPVRLAGPFSPQQARQIYDRIDLLVVPSVWPETSPLVIREAQLAGLPVLASRTGGIPELVTHGRNGLLVEPGSARALARALATLLDSPSRLEALARNAPRVKTPEQDAAEWEIVYHEVARHRVQHLAGNIATGPPRSSRVPEVSILLLTRDGGARLRSLLESLAGQQGCPSWELVVVDSGSTDGSLELLAGCADRLARIPASAFDHGLTRNLGLSLCSGELVVLLVQDAEPATDRWLVELTAPLVADARVAASTGRQVPRPDADLLTRMYLGRHLANGSSPRIWKLASPQALSRLPAAEQLRLCLVDNVCACIRRRVWQDHPFDRSPFAEDLAWAKEVLLAGHALAYTPNAVVLHSHHRSARYELWRTYLAHLQMRRLFGLRTIPTLPHLAAATAATWVSHLSRLVGQGGYWSLHQGRDLVRALGLGLALPLGQYLGALSADLGWQPAVLEDTPCG